MKSTPLSVNQGTSNNWKYEEYSFQKGREKKEFTWEGKKLHVPTVDSDSHQATSQFPSSNKDFPSKQLLDYFYRSSNMAPNPPV